MPDHSIRDPEAAERIAGMKKAAMAEAAERLVAGTGWLPQSLKGASAQPHDASVERVDADDHAGKALVAAE